MWKYQAIMHKHDGSALWRWKMCGGGQWCSQKTILAGTSRAFIWERRTSLYFPFPRWITKGTVLGVWSTCSLSMPLAHSIFDHCHVSKWGRHLPRGWGSHPKLACRGGCKIAIVDTLWTRGVDSAAFPPRTESTHQPCFQVNDISNCLSIELILLFTRSPWKHIFLYHTNDPYSPCIPSISDVARTETS